MDHPVMQVSRLLNLFSITNSQFFFIFIGIGLCLYLISQMRAVQRVWIFVILGASFLYFPPMTVLNSMVVAIAGHAWIKHHFPIKSDFMATYVGVACFFTLYLIVTEVTNRPLTAQYVTVGIAYVSTLWSLWTKRSQVQRQWIKLATLPSKLNAFDWSLLVSTFVFSSLPQRHWDAAQANLYIAKWYELTNTFSPIPEAISSLFPQGGNLYYAWFILNGFKALQLGIFLPALILILLIKSLQKKYVQTRWARYIIYAALFLPIFIFQASNGYYDLLNLCLILGGIVLILLDRSYVLACLLFGLASSLKMFPIIFMPLPILLMWHDAKYQIRNIPKLAIVLLITTLPLLGFMIRSYQTTGSPIFPFFQQYFPTPAIWGVNDHLEQNPMIQTSMNVKEWLTGQALLYPWRVFAKSSDFLEATPYYSGLIYVLLIPLQIYALYLSLRKISTRTHVINLYVFVAFLTVGIFTRYYRYLWPFQFVWLLTTLIVLEEKFSSVRIKKSYVYLIFGLIMACNWYSLISYYRYYPIAKNEILRPDYYLHEKNNADPILFLNNRLTKDDIILDNSTFMLPRLQFVSRVYQCNWYFINGQQHIATEEFTQKVTYLITDVSEEKTSYCTATIQKLLTSNTYHQIYQDAYYRIYEKN